METGVRRRPSTQCSPAISRVNCVNINNRVEWAWLEANMLLSSRPTITISPKQVIATRFVVRHICKMRPHTSVILFLSVIYVTTGVVSSLSCGDYPSCPENSACKIFNNQEQCLCNTGYQPSLDGSRCLKVLNFGDDCTKPGTTCRRGPWGSAVCIHGKCGCGVSYHQTGKTRCTMDAITKVGYSLLGEPCNETTKCRFARTQYCNEGICTCKKNLRIATEEFHSARPAIDECIPDDLLIKTR